MEGGKSRGSLSLSTIIVHKHPVPPVGDGEKRAIEQGRALAELAERQYGVVSRQQLVALGLGRGAIGWRLRSGRLHALHRGVYAVGHTRINQRGHWLAAVLAYGERAVLSHRSAAALWGFVGPRGPIDVIAPLGRKSRRGIQVHQGAVRPEEKTRRSAVPLTSVGRTLLDLADVFDETRLVRAFEEADRLRLVRMAELERVCQRGEGR